MTYLYLNDIAGALYFFSSYKSEHVVGMPLMVNLRFLYDTHNIFFELKGYDNTWYNLKTFYGNTTYLEMRFPGAAHLIRSSEVPGYHFGVDRYGDNTRTRLIETPVGGRWFLMNYTPGYVRI